MHWTSHSLSWMPRFPDQFVVSSFLKQGWMTMVLQGKKRMTWVLVCCLLQALSATAHLLILDSFIDNQDQGLDEGVPWQHLSWRNLSDWEEGLGKFLDGILKCSHNARQGVPIAGNSADNTLSTIVDTKMSSTSSDYPLWWVCCKVSATIISWIMETY